MREKKYRISNHFRGDEYRVMERNRAARHQYGTTQNGTVPLREFFSSTRGQRVTEYEVFEDFVTFVTHRIRNRFFCISNYRDGQLVIELNQTPIILPFDRSSFEQFYFFQLNENDNLIILE